MRKNTFSQQLLFRVCTLGLAFICATASANTRSGFFPESPAISLTGAGGNNGSDVAACADMMIPMYGSDTQMWYLDPQGLFQSTTDYAGSLGVGWRQMVNPKNILGAYVFGDYNHAPSGHGFLFLSPGLERLGNTIDVNANLYVPVGDSSYQKGEVFGDQIGIYDNMSFAGHKQFDELYDDFEEVGVGADMQIGCRLPFVNDTKVYLGGYYFNPKDIDSPIKGGTVRLDVPVNNHLLASLTDGYDNVLHNTVKLGLTLEMGSRTTGFSSDRRIMGYQIGTNLQDRMQDPVRRHLAATDSGWRTYSPIVDVYHPTGEIALEKTNISFFTPVSGGQPIGTGDGTYEDPYVGFTNDTVAAANGSGNRNLYVSSGSYESSEPITLTRDIVYGRTDYNGQAFFKPASGDTRPIFTFTGTDGFLLSGDNILNDIKILGDSNPTGSGIVAQTGTTSVTDQINDVLVSGFTTAGITLTDEDPLTTGGAILLSITGSTLSGNLGSGLLVKNSITSGSAITVSMSDSTLDSNGASGAEFDLNAASNATVSISDSQFTGNTDSGLKISNSGSGTAALNVARSVFDDNASGMYLDNSAGATNATINNATFEGNSADGLYINSSGTATTATINNTAFDSNGANGLEMANSGSATLTATITSATFDGNSTNGIAMTNSSSGISKLTLQTVTALSNGTNGLSVASSGTGDTTLCVTDGKFSSNITGDGLDIINTGTGTLTADIATASFDNNDIYGMSVNSSAGGATTVTIDSSSFDGNAYDGLSAVNAGAGTLTLGVTGSTFNDNGLNGMSVLNSAGGAIALTIGSSEFNENSGPTNAGLYLENDGTSDVNGLTVDITGSYFDDNTAGDGLFVDNSAISPTTITIDGSSFSGNGGDGLVIDNDGTADTAALTATITNSSFDGNGGNGVYMLNESLVANTTLTASGSSFSNNTLDGIRVVNSLDDATQTSEMHLTVNTSTLSGNGGYGIYAVNPSTVDMNSDLVQVTTSGNTYGSNGSGETNEADLGNYVTWNLSSSLKTALPHALGTQAAHWMGRALFPLF